MSGILALGGIGVMTNQTNVLRYRKGRRGFEKLNARNAKRNSCFAEPEYPTSTIMDLRATNSIVVIAAFR